MINRVSLSAAFCLLCVLCSAQDNGINNNEADVKEKGGLQWDYIIVEGGLNFTKFQYMDSKEEQSLITNMTNSPKERYAFGFGISPRRFDNLELHIGLANNNSDVKAYFVSGMTESYVHYDFDFLSADLGLNFRLLSSGKKEKEWSFLAQGGISQNWLLAGFQERSGSFVDLKAYDKFSNVSMDYNYGGAIRKKISPYSTLQLSYKLKQGLELEEQVIGGEYERYTFKTDVFTIGLMIDVPAVSNRHKKEKKFEDLAEKMIDKMAKGDSSEQAVADKIRKLVADYKDVDRKVANNTHDLDDINSQLLALENSQKEQSTSMGDGFSLDENKRLILFPFAKSQFYDVFKVELKALADTLKENPNLSLELEGYADIIGSSDYNVKLSKNRAERVRDFLVKQGISKDRMSVSYQGSTSKFDKYNFLFNRRVEITIISKK